MTPHEIIQDLADSGIRLSVRGGRLRAEGPAGLLADPLPGILREHNACLMEYLVRRPTPTWAEAVAWAESRGLTYELLERSAILEYDGGLPRAEAEEQAVREILERYGQES